MLDRYDDLPLYAQLRNILRDKIFSGVYKEGDLIPSEHKLISQYDVTRTTVRKALSDLMNEGLITKYHGKGSIVTFNQIKHNIWNFKGFTEYMIQKGEKPVSKIIEQEIIEQDGIPYFKLIRARGICRHDAIKYLTLDTSLLSVKLFPNIEKYDFSKISLYQTMKNQYDLEPKNALLDIHPIAADKHLSNILDCDEGSLLIKVKGSVFSESEKEIEKVNVVYGPSFDFKICTYINP